MARYSDIVLDEPYERPIPGVKVLVLNADGTAASLTNDASAPIANPVITDQFGAFTFNATDSVYAAKFSYGGSIIREANLIVGNPPQYIGLTGPADNTYTSLTALLASDKTRKKANLVGDTDVPTAPDGPFNVVDGAWVRQSGNGIRLNDLLNYEIRANFDATNANQWGMRIDSISIGQQVDSYFGFGNFYGAAAAGYAFHGIVYADADVGGGKVGGMGGAIGGPGPGSGVVGNRREDGIGHGVIGTRDGTGAGAGLLGTAQGTVGVQVGVRALKQNTTGAPGGPCGPGPALEVINSAEQGRAIESTTLANNADDVSNFYERRNITTGVVSRRAILLGGARTGALVVDDVLVQPATNLTGAFPITGQAVTLRAQVNGASEATGVSISNAATEGAAAYGVVGDVTGANAVNAGGRFSASGGTLNWSVYGVGKAYFSSLALGNSATATTLGTVARKIEVFDASGASIGFVPVYNSIS